MTGPLRKRAWHRCPGPACPEQVPASQLACGRHWSVLPEDIRAEVWAAYRADDEVGTRTALVKALRFWQRRDRFPNGDVGESA